MPIVLLVRHAQASFGAADYDVLSAVGRTQAELTASALAESGVRPSRVVTGTLRRQGETAEALAGGATKIEIDPRWDEYDADKLLGHHGRSDVRLEGVGFEVGPGTNQSFHETLETALREWIEAPGETSGIQPWGDFAAAGRSALEDLGPSLGSGESAVIVTSGGVIAAIVGHLLGAPDQTFLALNRVLVNASVTKLAIGSSGTNLITFNEHLHLEAGERQLVTYR